jgi:hypothetical protein
MLFPKYYFIYFFLFVFTGLSAQKNIFTDSLRQKLIAGDTLILNNPSDEFKSLVNKPIKDSITYSAITLLIAKKSIVEYVYPVNKSDTLQLYIKHNAFFTLRSVEVFFGKIPLYSRLKLKKNESINVKIPAIDQGELTIRINNNNYFPIKTRLFVRNLKKAQRVIIKEVIDTLYRTDTLLMTKEELQYLPLTEQTFHPGGNLDLTKNPYFIFRMPLDQAKNGIGWIYWLGYNNKNIEEFKAISADKDVLADYGTGKLHFLPISEPKNLNCAFVNESNALKLTRQGNYTAESLPFDINKGPNYGKILESTAKYNQKSLYLACLNTHGLFEQTVYLKSVYLVGNPYTEQVINKTPILNRYFKIFTE